MTTDQAVPSFAVRLFGKFEVRIDGSPLPKLRSRKEAWLLALLALEAGGRPVSRVQLAQTLWPFPDHSADQAAYNLRRSLTGLRKALGTQVFRLQSPTPRTLFLDLTNAEIDVTAFDAATARGDTASLEKAVALYAGPLLPDCTETWASSERAKREQTYLKALELLSAHAVTGGDYEAAERYLRQAVGVDTLRESAQRALMEVLAKKDDHNAAIQVYQQLSRLLHRERNAVPDPETTALFHAVRAELRTRARNRTRVPEPDLPATPAPRRLPVPLTTLIGREEQVREIETRLRLVRLLTLTGSGGVGKTRLAVQVAEETADDYRDGAWFVDLGALTDPALVVQTTASVLDMREEPGHSLMQTLIETLQSRHLLLILDGCEHLVAACARMAETLLQGCRHLRILATTRQPLGVSGEAVWRVPSLSLPDSRRLPADDRDLPSFLVDYAAVRLFAERAALVQPGFKITPENGRTVTQICRRLDGIPLAIELAAARVKALPIEQIARRLNQVFRLLTGGPRTAFSRQQTLETTIRWSCDLLSEAERRLLRRLSVFAGGWTLEAAEAVCMGDGIEEWEVLDLLTALVDKSLVLYEEQNGQARYRFLETVRQYCRERLGGDEPELETSRRHLDFYLRLAEAAERPLHKSHAEAWLNGLEAEHDNFRAALEWALAEEGCARKALRLAGALWRFWYRRAYLSEGRGHLGSVLSKPTYSEPCAERAKACNGAGFLAFHQGDNAAAQRFLEESLASAQSLGDQTLIAEALQSQGYMAWYWNDYAEARVIYERALAIQSELENREEIALTLSQLGIIASDLGDYAAARRFFEESLALAKELGDKTLVAGALHSQGHMAFYQGDYAAARALYEEVLALGKELKERERIAVALHRLGNVAYAVGDQALARRYFEESLALGREIEEKPLMAAALYSLGMTVRAQGDYAAARILFKECLAIHRELRDNRAIADLLDAFAVLASAQREERRAAVLFGAADELRAALHTPLSSAERTEIDDCVTAVRTALGDHVYTAAESRGRLMAIEEAVAFALEETSDDAVYAGRFSDAILRAEDRACTELRS